MLRLFIPAGQLSYEWFLTTTLRTAKTAFEMVGRDCPDPFFCVVFPGSNYGESLLFALSVFNGKPPKHMKVLIWVPSEAWPFSHGDFRQAINQCGVDERDIFMVSGNLGIADCARQAIGSTAINFIPYCVHEFDVHRRLQRNAPPPSFDTTPRPKMFLYKNRLIRPHRISFISELARRNLLVHSEFSWLNFSYGEAEPQLIDKYATTLYPSGMTKISGAAHQIFTNGKVIDGDDVAEGGHHTDQTIADRAYFSLVAESLPLDDGTLFLTEKTWQAIAVGHPFIFASTPNHLTQLRKMGYHSFPELFDEGYDLELSESHRFLKVIGTIQKICEDKDRFIKAWESTEVQEKIIQNFYTLRNKNFEPLTAEVFSTISQ